MLLLSGYIGKVYKGFFCWLFLMESGFDYSLLKNSLVTVVGLATVPLIGLAMEVWSSSPNTKTGSLERELRSPSRIERVERDYEVVRFGRDSDLGYERLEKTVGDNAGKLNVESFPLKASHDCVEMIKGFEKFSSTPYWDVKQWAIGYGHDIGMDKNHSRITKEKGLEYFREDLREREEAVARLVKVSITQGQYDAKY